MRSKPRIMKQDTISNNHGDYTVAHQNENEYYTILYYIRRIEVQHFFFLSTCNYTFSIAWP